MGLKEKEQFANDIYLSQPNLLGSVIVLRQFGVSLEKIEFAILMLLVCFKAMKVSGLTWPLITEDDLDLQSQRYTAIIQFSQGLNENLRARSAQQYVEDHPEKELLAYIQMETANWLASVTPEETDKYVVSAVSNLVNCIAFVDL